MADTVISSLKQEKISVKWRKTPEERKYDVIYSQYWHKWVQILPLLGAQGKVNLVPLCLLQSFSKKDV